jgi:phosphoglycerate dehydrogenase-like enzyme
MAWVSISDQSEHHDKLAMPGPKMEDISVGIIGMGDMGKMYAHRLSQAGWR